ncbi:ribulose-phosphate 3-epimerase [Moniliophthora roreri]|nr:ribulose-phosphate 3-epimerase [Moniliophthora roreri]
MPQAIVSPSVLASDFGQLTAECKRMMKDGADWLHMVISSPISLWASITDLTVRRTYRPLAIIGAPILSCVHKGVPGIFMDCHMMVAQPEKWVNDIADAGGALYCFHIEATSDPISLIKAIRDRGMKAGVAISPDTPSTAITDEIGTAADMLLVMTKFIERCVPKVAELRARFPEKDIEVDGGVGPNTIGVCADAGSNVIVAGTAIFGAADPAGVIKTLKETVNTAQARLRS